MAKKSTERQLFSTSLDIEMLDFKIGLILEDLEEEGEEAEDLKKSIEYIRHDITTLKAKINDIRKDVRDGNL